MSCCSGTAASAPRAAGTEPRGVRECPRDTRCPSSASPNPSQTLGDPPGARPSAGAGGAALCASHSSPVIKAGAAGRRGGFPKGFCWRLDKGQTMRTFDRVPKSAVSWIRAQSLPRAPRPRRGSGGGLGRLGGGDGAGGAWGLSQTPHGPARLPQKCQHLNSTNPGTAFPAGCAWKSREEAANAPWRLSELGSML